MCINVLVSFSFFQVVHALATHKSSQGVLPLQEAVAGSQQQITRLQSHASMLDTMNQELMAVLQNCISGKHWLHCLLYLQSRNDILSLEAFFVV
jgi:hypothetical protein